VSDVIVACCYGEAQPSDVWLNGSGEGDSKSGSSSKMKEGHDEMAKRRDGVQSCGKEGCLKQYKSVLTD